MMFDRPQNKHLRPVQPGEVRNPKGRPKGSKHKLTESFWREFTEAWEEHGKAELNKLAVEDPATFVRIAASVVQKQFDTEPAKPLEELTDAELTAIIRDGQAVLADFARIELAENSQ